MLILILYCHRKATQQQRLETLQVIEWFCQDGSVSLFEFGKLAWQLCQKTNFIGRFFPKLKLHYTFIVNVSTSLSYVQNMIENIILTSYLDKSYLLCHKLMYIFCKHSNDVMRQVETPSKRTMSHWWLRYDRTAKQVSATIDECLV